MCRGTLRASTRPSTPSAQYTAPHAPATAHSSPPPARLVSTKSAVPTRRRARWPISTGGTFSLSRQGGPVLLSQRTPPCLTSHRRCRSSARLVTNLCATRQRTVYQCTAGDGFNGCVATYAFWPLWPLRGVLRHHRMCLQLHRLRRERLRGPTLRGICTVSVHFDRQQRVQRQREFLARHECV